MFIKLSDDKEYEFKPLTLGSIIKFQPKLKEMKDEDYNLMLDIIYDSFKRSNSLTKEELSDLIDLSNFQNVFLAVMNKSELVNKDTEEKN